MEVILINVKQVMHVTGLCKAAIYASMAKGDFPRPVKVGPQSVRWFRDEIVEWIQKRPRTA